MSVKDSLQRFYRAAASYFGPRDEVGDEPLPEVRKALIEDAPRVMRLTLWGIIARPYVQDIAPLPLPDGGETFPVISGVHAVTQMWCTDGSCE